MKNFALSLFLLLQITFCYGQITYEKSLAAAFIKAAAKKKLVFVHIDFLPSSENKFPLNGAAAANASNIATSNSPTKIYQADLSGHVRQLTSAEALKNPLEDVAVARYYNKHFVNYHTHPGDTVGMKLMKKYNINAYPSYLFLDARGVLTYKKSFRSHSDSYYTDMANKALSLINTAKTLHDYEEQYKKGKADRDFLKTYLTLRQEMEIQQNACLLETYVNYLTPNDANDYKEVLFVLKSGPFSNGKAFKFANTNKKIVDSIYKVLPLQQRIEMNNRIISNTLTEAIHTKNNEMAKSAANFTRNSWGKNYIAADKQSRNKMVTYYRAVKDTLRFYQEAEFYYDHYFMNVSNDTAQLSRKKRELVTLVKKISAMGQPEAPFTTSAQGVNAANPGAENLPSTSQIANTLNNAAWEFYLMGIRTPATAHNKNMSYLLKALLWSKRSIELEPLPAYYDTIAHLFYQLNLFDEAQLNQQKAIDIMLKDNKPKSSVDFYRAAAEKMKNRQL